MNEQPRTGTSEATTDGSGWAALDETFFRLVQDTFSRTFCEGAGALLATNNADESEAPRVVQLPEQPTAEDHAAARRAAMRRHPSSRGRF
jgi:hypothetical protein